MKYFLPITRRNPYLKKADNTYYTYRRYQLEIAEDCSLRCGYCDCHQDEVGGANAMEIDHFRPWNKSFGANKLFTHLKDDPTNLVHSCGVCNSFKSDHWPTEDPNTPFDNEKGWIDPFNHDRANYFQIGPDGTIEPLLPPSEYIIRTLRLNRPLLKKLRLLRCIWDKLAEFENHLKQVIASEPNTSHAVTAEKSLIVFNTLKKLIQPPSIDH